MKAPPRVLNPQLGLPQASAAYRRRAWLAYQLSLDPLAEPQQLRPPVTGRP